MTVTTLSPADTLRDLVRRGDELIPRRNEAHRRCLELREQHDRLDLDGRVAFNNGPLGEAHLAAAGVVDECNVQLVRLYADQLAFLQSLDAASIRFLPTT